MVKRYPHMAIVTVDTGGCYVKGEYIPGVPSEVTVQGSYFASNSGQHVKRNMDGNEIVVHGEFSTKHLPIVGAKRIRIDSIALDVSIICWERFQTHSVIYV